MVVIVTDVAVVTAMHAVVFQECREHLIVGQIIHGHDFKLGGTGHQVPKRQATDTSKTIDRDANSHRSVSPTGKDKREKSVTRFRSRCHLTRLQNIPTSEILINDSRPLGNCRAEVHPRDLLLKATR